MNYQLIAVVDNYNEMFHTVLNVYEILATCHDALITIFVVLIFEILYMEC